MANFHSEKLPINLPIDCLVSDGMDGTDCHIRARTTLENSTCQDYSLPDGYAPQIFKTVAFDRSATSPAVAFSQYSKS